MRQPTASLMSFLLCALAVLAGRAAIADELLDLLLAAQGATCGGIAGLTCDAGEFCDYPIEAQCGAADQTGVCQPIPQICTLIYQPVCGCDGTTYSSPCDAAASGVSVASMGECADSDADTGPDTDPNGGQSGDGGAPPSRNWVAYVDLQPSPDTSGATLLVIGEVETGNGGIVPALAPTEGTGPGPLPSLLTLELLLFDLGAGTTDVAYRDVRYALPVPQGAVSEVRIVWQGAEIARMEVGEVQ